MNFLLVFGSPSYNDINSRLWETEKSEYRETVIFDNFLRPLEAL